MAAFFKIIEGLLVAIPGKTYMAAIGCIAKAIYDVIITKDYSSAFNMVLAALTALGLRTAVTKQTEDIKELTDLQTKQIRSDTKFTVESNAAPSRFVQ